MTYPINECTAEEIPTQLRAFFSDHSKNLISLGFSHKNYFIHEKAAISQQIGYVEHLLNSLINTSAKLYYLVSSDNMRGCIEFSTICTDGFMIITSNSPSSIFKKPDHMLIQRIPTDDISKLLHKHRSAVETIKDTHTIKNINEYRYIWETEKLNKELLSFQEHNGLMKQCADGNAYKPTVTGSIFIVCNLWMRLVFSRKGFSL